MKAPGLRYLITDVPARHTAGERPPLLPWQGFGVLCLLFRKSLRPFHRSREDGSALSHCICLQRFTNNETSVSRRRAQAFLSLSAVGEAALRSGLGRVQEGRQRALPRAHVPHEGPLPCPGPPRDTHPQMVTLKNMRWSHGSHSNEKEKQSGIQGTCCENIFRRSQLTIRLLFKECQGWLA